MPFTALWSGIFLKNRQRLSNAPVERWFGILKNTIANKVMRQKCSRLIRKLRKYILFTCKESFLDIPKSRCSKAPIQEGHDKGLASQEIWEKKKRKSYITTFWGHPCLEL